MVRTRLGWRCLIVLAGAAVTACAAPPTGAGNPAAVEAVNRDAPPRCEPGRTFSCVERIGKPVRCLCADKASLREVFDPLSTVR